MIVIVTDLVTFKYLYSSLIVKSIIKNALFIYPYNRVMQDITAVELFIITMMHFLSTFSDIALKI